MPNENEPTKPPEGQPAEAAAQPAEDATLQWVPLPVHPQAEFRKRKRARHEAGHIVVTDDLGWKVQWANLQQTSTDWAGFDQQLAQTNWNDAAQREAIKPLILNYVTMLVAGHLAEQEVDPAEQLRNSHGISSRSRSLILARERLYSSIWEGSCRTRSSWPS